MVNQLQSFRNHPNRDLDYTPNAIKSRNKALLSIYLEIGMAWTKPLSTANITSTRLAILRIRRLSPRLRSSQFKARRHSPSHYLRGFFGGNDMRRYRRAEAIKNSSNPNFRLILHNMLASK